MWINQDKMRQQKQRMRDGRRRQQKILKEDRISNINSKLETLKEPRVVLRDIARSLLPHQQLFLENWKKWLLVEVNEQYHVTRPRTYYVTSFLYFFLT